MRAPEAIAVPAITWLELPWLARQKRIWPSVPTRSWLEYLARRVRAYRITPAIGATAGQARLRDGNETGRRLVTQDRRLLIHRHPGTVTLR